jgi:phage terminase Nu1 subunit (DNA packaging protein)
MEKGADMLAADLDDLIGGTAALKPDSNLVTAHALADLLGLSDRAVRDLGTRGIAVKAADGVYRQRESVRSYCTHIREMAGGRAGSKTLTEERVRIATAQANKLERENAVARNEMLPAKEVERAWAGVLRDVRSAMLALPSRFQMRLTGLSLSVHDVSEIDREIRDALTEVTQ